MIEPDERAKAEAKAHPNAHVYAIAGNYSATERVPPQAIAGCWKTDANGEIVGEFIPNPNFDPEFRKP